MVAISWSQRGLEGRDRLARSPPGRRVLRAEIDVQSFKNFVIWYAECRKASAAIPSCCKRIVLGAGNKTLSFLVPEKPALN
jgi:hypothetical protein